MSKYSRKIEKTTPQKLTVSVAPPEVERVWLGLRRTQQGLAVLLLICAAAGALLFRASQTRASGVAVMPAVLASIVLTFAYSARNQFVLPALEELRRNPRDPRRLEIWRKATLRVQGMCAMVGLAGFAAQAMGAATAVSLILYAIAIAYLFLLRPEHP
jgi:hypothetical protein